MTGLKPVEADGQSWLGSCTVNLLTVLFRLLNRLDPSSLKSPTRVRSVANEIGIVGMVLKFQQLLVLGPLDCELSQER
jgi:hypothetical protein